MTEEYKETDDIVRKDDHVDVDGGSVGSCESEAVEVNGIDPDAFDAYVINAPTVLAERNIRVNVSVKVKLPTLALEIQNIKNKLKVTQCMLMQAPPINGATDDEVMLFISGFIRKKIDYTTPGICRNDGGICGDVRHCTIDAPFSCTTPIDDFVVPPATILPAASTEFEFFRRQSLPREFAEKDKLMSADLSEFNQVSTEYYNNLPYCELISNRIIEYNEFLGRRWLHDAPFEERAFKEFESKMVVNMVVKIIQNRQTDLTLT